MPRATHLPFSQLRQQNVVMHWGHGLGGKLGGLIALWYPFKVAGVHCKHRGTASKAAQEWRREDTGECRGGGVLTIHDAKPRFSGVAGVGGGSDIQTKHQSVQVSRRGVACNNSQGKPFKLPAYDARKCSAHRCEGSFPAGPHSMAPSQCGDSAPRLG